MNKKVRFEDLGLIDYKKCWDYQEALFAEILAVKSTNRKSAKTNKTTNHLLFCEHPHVYTLGKSGNKNNLLVNEEYLKIASEFDLSESFITSKAEAKSIVKDDRLFKLDGIENIKVSVTKAQGKKCNVCWKIFKDKCDRHGDL